MKARITIRQSVLNNNTYTIINGKDWTVLHANDIKTGLLNRIENLRNWGLDYTANKILKCIRVS